MTPQRVTLITLGVNDLARSRAFHAALGRVPAQAAEGVVFYQMHGTVLGLFGRADLAADQGRPGATLGTGAITLAQNFATEAEVDAGWNAGYSACSRRAAGVQQVCSTPQRQRSVSSPPNP